MKNRFSGVSTAEISQLIDRIEYKAPANIFRQMFSLLDLTSLNVTDNESTIRHICGKLNNFPYEFPDLPDVAAICVFPRFVPLVKEILKVEQINIAAVAASFPTSQTFIENKIDECKRAIDAGAEELDIVISLGEFLDGNYDLVASEIKSIKDLMGCRHLKVILESGIIEKPELVYEASMLAMNAGADFIKTSSGKAHTSATKEAAWVMCAAIKDYHGQTGREVGFKPAGGIGTASEAEQYYSIVDGVLGKQWLAPGLFRIGASRLANDLLAKIEGRKLDYF
ncbi:MAG: deoxyribose-phosphate aldolase [Marinilabiliaceae bacterium]|jgi:deoxyribose-phosphate aldolase|nr:deoxyribose-phosphate aldolase [Marinilabiliaceae bacterium]